MIRNHKIKKQKNLIQLVEELYTLERDSRHAGTFVDVEPYRWGWERNFVLRDDAKNRSDARELRQILDLINMRVHSHRKDFKYKDWKTKLWMDIPQKLKYLNEYQYQSLNEKKRSYFVKREWCETNKHTKKKIFYSGYVFKNDWLFTFKITPCIVDKEWIPNTELESRIGEIRTKINRDCLWPQVSRARSKSCNHKEYDYRPPDPTKHDIESFFSEELGDM